jgi:hypothetical protein
VSAVDARADADEGESPPGARRSRWSPADWTLIAAVAGAALPVVTAAIARVRSHWTPGGDEAVIARLSHDVISSHTPLLGMPSTITAGVKLAGDASAHHLGPMLFWVFAIPDRLSGSAPSALVVTIALVNIASIAAVAWQVRRRAGTGVAVVAMLGVTALLWSFGRDLTVQIWNPYAALLPLLLFLVLAWSVACGDLIALPLAALVGSFVMQCHILYAFPVVIVAIVSALAFVLRRDPAERARRPAGRRRRHRHAGSVPAAVEPASPDRALVDTRRVRAAARRRRAARLRARRIGSPRAVELPRASRRDAG